MKFYDQDFPDVLIKPQEPVPCLTCENNISTNATLCPHCGEPDAGRKSLDWQSAKYQFERKWKKPPTPPVEIFHYAVITLFFGAVGLLGLWLFLWILFGFNLFGFFFG